MNRVCLKDFSATTLDTRGASRGFSLDQCAAHRGGVLGSQGSTQCVCVGGGGSFHPKLLSFHPKKVQLQYKLLWSGPTWVSQFTLNDLKWPQKQSYLNLKSQIFPKGHAPRPL